MSIGKEIDLVLERLLNESHSCDYHSFDSEWRRNFRKVPLKVILNIIKKQIEEMPK